MINNLSFLTTNTAGGQVSQAPVAVGSNVLNNDVPMVGDILATNTSAPATPTPGSTRIYVDTVGKLLSAINDAGAISRTVFPATAPAGQFATGVTTAGALTFAAPAALPKNYLDGFIGSNDGTSPLTVLDFSGGQAADNNNAVAISNNSTFTKSTGGAWVAGNGNNGMGVALSASTWYFAHVIINGGFFDIYFDTSPTGANAPAGTTAFRCIYPFKTNASSQILPSSQDGDDWLWATPIKDVNFAATPTTQTNVALTVPAGIITKALFNGEIDTSTTASLSFASPAVASTALPVMTGTSGLGSLSAINSFGNGLFSVRTNTSQQITVLGNAASTYVIVTLGWTWRRGRQ